MALARLLCYLAAFTVAAEAQSLSPTLASRASCEPADPSSDVTARLQALLNSGGTGYTLSLCPSQNYLITAPLTFTAGNQEISTAGYPSDDTRALLTVSGPKLNHSSAIIGTCPTCDGIKVRHIQINGNRAGALAIAGTGGNIEMGGNNKNQLVEFVHSYDPRGWTCLHLLEGGGSGECFGATIQNNDIGPSGSADWLQWADGISMACAGSTVRNNLVNSASDGGIVIFGAPGSTIENNTIWVETHSLLGGINLVDMGPYSGSYAGTVVRNNNIVGGFSTETNAPPSDSKGTNSEDAIIKIGIAMGTRIWFGDVQANKVVFGATVENNRLEGAFGYAMAISNVRNFTVQGNELVGNTSFIGSTGPNCSKTDTKPTSQPFILQNDTITSSNIQSNFDSIPDADALTCIVPPDGGDFWPFGGNPDVNSPTPPAIAGQSGSGSGSGGSGSSSHGSSTGRKVGLAVGLVGGLLLVCVAAWFFRKWALSRRMNRGAPSQRWTRQMSDAY